MSTLVRRLILALQFLTVAAVRPGLRARERDLAGSMVFFPLIGLVLGAALAAARRWPLAVFPPVLADALAVVLMLVFTRGLHLEGVADSADGLIGGLDRDKALAVMKDPRSGAFAVIAVVAVLLIKWAGLMSLTPGLKVTALVLMPVAGRWAMVAATWGAPYARAEGGLGQPFVEGLKSWEVAVAGLSALAFGVLASGAMGGLIMLGAAVWAWLARLYLKRRLGGVTGDIIGAVGETAEVGSLLALAALGV